MSRRTIYEQALKDIASDPEITDNEAFNQLAADNILSDERGLHFAQVYMFIHEDVELRRMWLRDYGKFAFVLEDILKRKDMDVRDGVAELLTDHRFTTRGRFLMLYVFGVDSGFARRYKVFEVHGRRWPEWIWRKVQRELEGVGEEEREGMFTMRDEDLDIMDEEDWEEY